MLHRILLCALLSIATANALAQQWLEEDNGQYTIYYVSEYEQDVAFVRRWMDQAERLMLDKYGIQQHGYDISVYLPPAPTQYTNRGLATLLCCAQNAGEIHYMTPSSPAYGNGPLGSLSINADDYHAKTLIHEYITVGHTRVSANKTSGFTYYSAPSWFHQGLEEFDGMFHSTESNKVAGYKSLIDYADRYLRDTFYDFGSTSSYFGGLVLMQFMADQYGEEIHADLLKSEQPTFAHALDEELAQRNRTVSEAYDDFERWFEAKVSGGIDAIPMARVFNLYFAHSAAGGGWRTDLVLLNTYRNRTSQATVQVFDQDGAPRTEEQLSLLELSAVEWTLPEGEGIETGGVVVSSSEDLSGFLRFRHEGGAATSVQSAPVGSTFMIPVSNEADQTGLAVYNAADKDLTVVLRMGDVAVYKDIPRQGKIAGFVDEYFPNLGDPAGTLVVETDPPGDRITVLALEIINGNLVTLPAAPLDGIN